MKLVINLLLLALIGVLIWVLIGSIREPIHFRAEKDKRERAVIDKLMEIRNAQELYRSITGNFAGNFDTLKYVLSSDSFRIIQVFGDPDDPNNTEAIRYDTIYRSSADSIKYIGMNLDSLRYVPYGGGAVFEIQADTLTYQSTLVQVVEVGVSRKVFMGTFADIKYSRYDNSYDPEKVIKFGDMGAPNISGNWER
ncbi:MAG: hypothetical protein IPJ40_19880 [Saprospirales bacterium]|nr:hypothetical protein [Saprospirales bacterium]